MTEQEIKENNKLIALFMEGIYSEHAEAWGFGNARIETTPLKVQGKTYKNAVWAERWEKELKYHFSPEWLFPVLEKILAMYDSQCSFEHPRFSNTDDKHTFWFNLIDDCKGGQTTKGDTLIEAMWLGIVNFIKWYNKSKE